MRSTLYTLTGLLMIAVAPPSLAADKHDHDHAHADKPTHDEPAHADEVHLTAEAVKRNGIRVESASRRALRPTFTASARVAFNANAIAHVGSAVKGRVAELHAHVGDVVKKDDVLLVVESPELGEAQSDFVQKRAAVGAAEPAVESAKGAYERAKELYDQSKGISLTDLQKRETDYKSAQAALSTARAAATAAENKLHLLGMDQPAVDALARSGEIKPRFPIRAPLDGEVTEREVTLGELVSPDREHLLIVADLSTLWVQADVPEARLRGLKKGTPARISLAAMPEEKLAGTVAFVAQTVDPATRTAKLRIEVKNDRGELKPGMFAVAEIAAAGEPAADALAVPDEAVQTVEGGPAVFVPVPGEENTFAKRAVTVGKPAGGWVPVLSGLKEGEPFVAAGSFILKADLGKAGAAHEH